MDCGQKVAPVSHQLEHSNFSSQEVLSSHYQALLDVQHHLIEQGVLHCDVTGKDCMHAAASDVHEFDATCTSRDNNGHAKAPGIGTDPQAHHSSQFGPWPQQQHNSQDAGLDQDQFPTQRTTYRQQQQVTHQVYVAQQPASREQQKLQKKVHELEDMLQKISAGYDFEKKLAPESNYLDFPQPSDDHVTPQMRMIVCSWLSEVATEFNMQQETLFLSVALLDRFMSDSNGVPRSALQLVAVACMLVAAKHEEVIHPNLEEFTDIAANCFQVEDLRRMERLLIGHLAWQIKTPTAYSFLHLYTQAAAMGRDISALQHIAHGSGSIQPTVVASLPKALEPMSGQLVAKAAYLTELSMLDYQSLAFRPSQVAASALLLAQTWSEQVAAPQEIQSISGYSSSDLCECMGQLLQLHHHAATCDACDTETSEMLAPFKHIKEKYAQDCWLHTSHCEVPTATLEALAPGVVAGLAANPTSSGQDEDEDMGIASPPNGFWN